MSIHQYKIALDHEEGKLQTNILSSEQVTAAHLRITILAGIVF